MSAVFFRRLRSFERRWSVIANNGGNNAGKEDNYTKTAKVASGRRKAKPTAVSRELAKLLIKKAQLIYDANSM